MDKVRVLQIGQRDWRGIYTLPGEADFQYAESFEEASGKPYDLVFWDRAPLEEEMEAFQKAIKAHTLYVTEPVELQDRGRRLYECKKGKRIAEAQIQDFLSRELRNYFPKPYGEKFRPGNLTIARGFPGHVKWYGNQSVLLEGDYGEELHQIACWRNNIPVFEGQCLDLWLEYRKSPEVEIAMRVTQFVQGSIAEVQQQWEFSERELEDIVRIDNRKPSGPIFVSLLARGRGELRIIALHDRYSRRGHGHFLPGGERYVTSDREEIFCYFDPGDGKPPLNVYFSGYKTLEGFEGYNLMRGMGCPFLLVAEARLEGGCFYMGSEEYEKTLAAAIEKYGRELGFGPEQMILSGLSMGTFGALYYGCDIRPYAMILGKPLASIGSVAANERLLRPGGFPTSLDVLAYLCGSTDQAAAERLNRRFWDKFDAADWSRSRFIVSYMIEDDYDASAYATLISHLQSEGVQVYGKGLHGRHNDNTGGIVNWFSGQFEKILREDFGRT